MYFSMPKIIKLKYIPSLKEMFLPPSQNILGVCHHITLLILYYGSSKLVILLKVIDVPKQVSDVFYVTSSLKFIHFSFQIFLFFFLKCLLASRLTLFRLATSFWFAFCNHCRWDCFTPVKTEVPTNNSHHVHNGVAAPEIPQASCQERCASCTVWERCKIFKVLVQVYNRKAHSPPLPRAQVFVSEKL